MLHSLSSTDCRLLWGEDAKPTVKCLYPTFLFFISFVFKSHLERSVPGRPWCSLQVRCLQLDAGEMLWGEASPAAPRYLPSPPVRAGDIQQPLVPGGALAWQSLLALGLFWVMGSSSWELLSVLQ